MIFDEKDASRLFDIVDAGHNGKISYTDFCSAFRISDVGIRKISDRADWQDSVVQQVANILFQHRIQLRAAFRMFDVDNSGKIAAEDFTLGLSTINTLLDNPLSSIQIAELRRTLDRGNMGTVDYAAFLEGLQIVDTGSAS